MFWNYLKVSLRNLYKYKIFSFINIFGLAVSMCVCLVIISMIADLKQYDRFHSKKDRTFRIISWKESEIMGMATSPYLLAPALLDDYPVVVEATRMRAPVGGDIAYNQKILTTRGFFADNSYFSVFDFEFEKGNPGNALVKPNSIVLNGEFAKKLFGNEDPLGKVVDFMDRGLIHLDIAGIDKPPVSWGTFVVTGVIADRSYKTHMKWDILVSTSTIPVLVKEEKIDTWSQNWENYSTTYTYVVLPDKNRISELETALQDIRDKQYSENEDFDGFQLRIQALTKITPGKMLGNFTSFRMPIEGFYFLSFLAFIIMSLACLNYTNLSIARALTRAREVGVRKVTGAIRKNLVGQFMSESIITALFSLVIAILLLIFLKPALMSLWINKYLSFGFNESMTVYLIFLGFAVFIGIIAGLYPALYMSRYKPIIVLRKIDQGKTGKLGMRKFMIITQFVVSLFFIVTTMLIYKQLNHYLNIEYGFNTENIVNIELQSNDYEVMANEFSSIPNVSEISACEYIPATGISNGINIRKEGSEEEHIRMTRISIDNKFISNLDIELLYGNNLPDISESSNGQFFVVNEMATRELGFENPSEIVGEAVEILNTDQLAEVVGVVEDFIFRLPMLEDEIGPLVLRTRPGDFSFMNVKVNTADLGGTIDQMETKWKELDPVHEFKYDIFDEQMAGTNQAIVDVVSIVGFVTFLTIIIACLGLLGMATYSVERRIKEVGIRKVFGANDKQITFLLSKGFIKLLIISIIISAPLTYFINNLWLQNFPNKVDFGIGLISLGTLILLVLGLLTISTQTLRASRSNPVNTLRNE
ncbi:ABC transporter permease [Bacteroidota bacterium]